MIRKVLKITGIILITLVIMIIIILLLGYTSDIAIDQLEEKYTNSASKYLHIDGTKIHYRREGQGDPVLLIHGTAASLHTWDDWTEILKDSFEIIRLDLPAFGLTGPLTSSDYSIDNYVTILDAFMKKLNISSFHIAGNSLGGRISWNYACTYPEQIKKMILIDASGFDNGVTPAVIKMGRSDILSPIFRSVTPRWFIEKNMKEVYHDDTKITDELIDRYHRLSLRPGNRQAFIDRTRVSYPNNTDCLKTINHQTLIMWGAHDAWIPLTDAYRYQDLLPNDTLVIYQSGHVPMEENPVITSHDALQFLKSK